MLDLFTHLGGISLQTKVCTLGLLIKSKDYINGSFIALYRLPYDADRHIMNPQKPRAHYKNLKR